MLSGAPTLILWWHACMTRNSMSTASGKPAGCRHALHHQRPLVLVFGPGWHRVGESSTRKQTEWLSGADSCHSTQWPPWSVVWCELIGQSLVLSTLSTCSSKIDSDSWRQHSAMLIIGHLMYETHWFTHLSMFKIVVCDYDYQVVGLFNVVTVSYMYSGQK